MDAGGGAKGIGWEGGRRGSECIEEGLAISWTLLVQRGLGQCDYVRWVYSRSLCGST
jgi:hypothetical protein